MKKAVMEAETLRDALVYRLIRNGAVRTSDVERALRAVPRHLFMSEVPLAEAYEDKSIVLKSEEGRIFSSIGQPTMVAVQLEQLSLAPGMRVLEIGTGSGYNAALLADIVGKAGLVCSVELEASVADIARERLQRTGYGRILIICAEGAAGYPGEAPYDRIIVTTGISDLCPAWLEQLRHDGLLVVPLRLGKAQVSVTFAKHDDADDALESRSVYGCGFAAARGGLSGRDTIINEGSALRTLTEMWKPELWDKLGAFRIAAQPQESAIPDEADWVISESYAFHVLCNG